MLLFVMMVCSIIGWFVILRLKWLMFSVVMVMGG